MGITKVGEYLYKGTGDNDGDYAFAGLNYGTYYSYVLKFKTDGPITINSITLSNAGTDNTDSTKYLGAYFVSCNENDTPSSNIYNKSLASIHQTRLRFDYKWQNGSFISGTTGKAVGYTDELTLQKGYFFVYIGHAVSGTSNSYRTYSSFYKYGASNNYGVQISFEEVQIPVTVSFYVNENLFQNFQTIADQSITIPYGPNNFTEKTPPYTMYFDPNGGKVNNSTEALSKQFVDEIEYSFAYWTDEEGYSYYPGQSFTPNSDTNFYGYFNWNYITSITLPTPTKIDFTENKRVSFDSRINNLTFEDSFGGSTESVYECIGWYWYDIDNNEYIKIGDPNGIIYGGLDGAVLLAFWSEEPVSSSNPTPIILPIPNKVTGYEFQGWSIDGTIENIIRETIYIPTTDITLYGVWEVQGGIYMYLEKDKKWHRVVIHNFINQNWQTTEYNKN